MSARSVPWLALGLALLAGCAPKGSAPAANGSGGANAQGGAGSGSNPGTGGVALGGSATGGQGMLSFGGTGSAGDTSVGGGGPVRDPNSCEEAEKFRTYLGCEFYPTVTANVVSSVFDFAVVVANASDQPANVTVTGPNAFSASATVAAHELTTLYLPWVDALKGPSLSSSCSAPAQTASVLARGGA